MKKATRWAELRRAAGMTQIELAQKLGVSDMTVYRWEREDKQPKIDILPIMAQALNTSTDYLLGLTDDPSPAAVTPVSNGAQGGINSHNNNAVTSVGDATVNTLPETVPTVPARPWWLDVLTHAYEMESAGDPRSDEAAVIVQAALDVLKRASRSRTDVTREAPQLVNA